MVNLFDKEIQGDLIKFLGIGKFRVDYKKDNIYKITKIDESNIKRRRGTMKKDKEILKELPRTTNFRDEIGKLIEKVSYMIKQIDEIIELLQEQNITIKSIKKEFK